MKFHEVSKAMDEGKKIKLKDWDNAYWYKKGGIIINHDEEGFKKTWGDFFRDIPIFGGMWDYLLVDKEGKPQTVLEMKTTKRSEDWVEDVPEYYALQAALYAYLLGVDDVIMVCSVLGEKDYDDPAAYECKAENTFVRPFKVWSSILHHESSTEEISEENNMGLHRVYMGTDSCKQISACSSQVCRRTGGWTL